MSELSNQIEACKARRQRFVDAAARYANKARASADIKQQDILMRVLESPALPPVRREYEIPSRQSISLPIIWRIKKAVADEFGITIDKLVSRSQFPKDCLPRYVAIGLMLDLTRMSLPAIGRQLGGRDHATIINGRRQLDGLLKGEAFRNRFEQIKAGLA